MALADCFATFNTTAQMRVSGGAITLPVNYTLADCKRFCCHISSCNAIDYDISHLKCNVFLRRVGSLEADVITDHYDLIQRIGRVAILRGLYLPTTAYLIAYTDGWALYSVIWQAFRCGVHCTTIQLSGVLTTTGVQAWRPLHGVCVACVYADFCFTYLVARCLLNLLTFKAKSVGKINAISSDTNQLHAVTLLQFAVQS